MQWWLRWGYCLSLSSILIGARSGWTAAPVETASSFSRQILLSPETPSDAKHNPSRLTAHQTCPTDIKELTTQLLQDLPGYANRTYQQFRIPAYVLVAGHPEFKPLPLGPGQRAVVPENPLDRSDPQQVFITTLERHYQGGRAVELQQYHWIFLAQTSGGWRLAMMYSMIGPYPAGYPASPPEETSDGSVAGAIRTWLRDCRSRSPNSLKLEHLASPSSHFLILAQETPHVPSNYSWHCR